jgi:hypothetical protein
MEDIFQVLPFSQHVIREDLDFGAVIKNTN